MRSCGFFKYCLLASLGMIAVPAQAQTLPELVGDLVTSHNRVQAARADAAAAQDLTAVARGGWYPTLSLTGAYGSEKQIKPNATDTHTPFKTGEIKVNQLLWDFGATNAAIDRAKLSEGQAETIVGAIQQGLILEGASAYINLVRAHQQVTYARDSEGNIRRQTGLEEARVERGSGLSTDVLQAKTQLAGAQAGRVAAEGGLIAAQNRFRAVFNRPVTDVSALRMPNVPLDMLPASLDDAIRTAYQNNPQLKVAQISTDVARETVTATKAAGWFPRVEAIASAKNKQDADGTLGNQKEYLAKVQVTFPFNLGFTSVNSVNAAESGVVAANQRLADARNTIEEQVRNAWENLATQRAKAAFLRNQANIAAEFLELARKERKLGTRSLLDVLNGETALISSQSAAASAEADVAIAAYTLLAAMGQLTPATIR